MGPSRTRLNLLLTAHGLATSPEHAQGLIMAGSVLVNGKRVDKPGTAVPTDATIQVIGPAIPYVSRGGLKLAHALDTFAISVTGLVAADAGASIGGFTDCLLQRGASRVYAIDVGKGQLHAKLRADPRVVLLEETNARYLNSLPEQPALAVFDLSFISLLTVLPAILRLLDPAATLITLIKPQFEASPKLVGKGGIVRSPQVRRDVVDSVLSGMAALGVTPLGLTASPIRGSAGNAEYLAYATLSPQREPPTGASLLASVAWD